MSKLQTKKGGTILKKKGIISLVLVFIMSVFLTACGNDRVEPKEAADVTANALVYGKDMDKLKKVFGEDGSNSEKDFEKGFKQSFKSTITSSTGTTADIDKQVDELYTALRDRVKEKATYTTKVTKEDKENPEVTYSIKGLDMGAVQQKLASEIQKEVTSDASLAADQDKLMPKVLEIYTNEIKKAEAVSTPTDVKLKLKVNSKDEGKWQMDSQTTFVKDLMQAFYMGNM